jgi:hypothetical protein
MEIIIMEIMDEIIYGDHLAWPLVVGALLGSEERSPAPDTC